MEVLNTTKIRLKDYATTMISDLTRRQQLHGEFWNMRNGRNIKGRSGKNTSPSNRKRSVICGVNKYRGSREEIEDKCVERGVI
jgi:hypothetical protein